MTIRLRGVLGGLLLIGLGVGLVQYFVLGPLAAAERGEAISYSVKLFFVIPMTFVVGLYGLIGAALFPLRFEQQFEARHTPFSQRSPAYKRTVIAIGLLIAASSAALWWWFSLRLDALGYN